MRLKSNFRDPISPALKWAGGKRWLVPRLQQLYAPYRRRRLVEPFAGGLSIALGMMPRHALLNDINPHLINFYRQLQKGLIIPTVMENDADCFYAARETFNRLLAEGQFDTPEAAGLFYYLNRTCFNGLCRFNSKGEYNVPFGRYKHLRYTTNFKPYAPLIERWRFACGDFQSLTLEKGDFVYADPPYDVEFTKYSKEDFRWFDQQRLAQWLASHPGPVVVSNQATERILALYEEHGFHIETVSAPRRIACNGNRQPAQEMLAWRNLG